MTDETSVGSSKERLRTLRKTVEHYARSERDHASGETIRELTEAAAVLQSLENAPETSEPPASAEGCTTCGGSGWIGCECPVCTPEKASGCPTHGMEHFFEGMCIKCGVVPAQNGDAGEK